MEFQPSLEGPGVQDQFSGLLNILGIHILIQIVKMDGNGLNIILLKNRSVKRFHFRTKFSMQHFLR